MESYGTTTTKSPQNLPTQNWPHFSHGSRGPPVSVKGRRTGAAHGSSGRGRPPDPAGLFFSINRWSTRCTMDIDSNYRLVYLPSIYIILYMILYNLVDYTRSQFFIQHNYGKYWSITICWMMLNVINLQIGKKTKPMFNDQRDIMFDISCSNSEDLLEAPKFGLWWSNVKYSV